MRILHNTLALLIAPILFGPAGLPQIHDSVLPSHTTSLDSQATSPDSERLVAEAIIAPIDRYGSKYVFLPVTIHTHHVTLILDLGTNGDWLSLDSTGMALAGLALPTMKDTTDALGRRVKVGSIALQLLDSVGVGAVEVQGVQAMWGPHYNVTPPSGLPTPVVGLVGASFMRQFDLLFDGPARRVRVYRPAREGKRTAKHARGDWLPPGLTAADCVPMVSPPDQSPDFVWIAVQANGHRVTGFFDSGSAATNMSVAAAKLLGITQHDANVHLLPPDSSPHFGDSERGKVYRVTGLALRLGNQPIHNDTALIMTSFQAAQGAPLFNLGLDAIRDQLFFVSYSTHRVCLGPVLRHAGS